MRPIPSSQTNAASTQQSIPATKLSFCSSFCLFSLSSVATNNAYAARKQDSLAALNRNFPHCPPFACHECIKGGRSPAAQKHEQGRAFPTNFKYLTKSLLLASTAVSSGVVDRPSRYFGPGKLLTNESTVVDT